MSLFSRSLEKWLKCKNDQLLITFSGFLGVGASSGGSWRLSWEGFGSYVGRCWLQDGVFFATLVDVGHLGAKTGEQERKMRWLGEKVHCCRGIGQIKNSIFLVSRKSILSRVLTNLRV